MIAYRFNRLQHYARPLELMTTSGIAGFAVSLVLLDILAPTSPFAKPTYSQMAAWIALLLLSGLSSLAILIGSIMASPFHKTVLRNLLSLAVSVALWIFTMGTTPEYVAIRESQPSPAFALRVAVATLVAVHWTSHLLGLTNLLSLALHFFWKVAEFLIETVRGE